MRQEAVLPLRGLASATVHLVTTVFFYKFAFAVTVEVLAIRSEKKQISTPLTCMNELGPLS